MPLTLSLAWRNLWRHGRRTWLTVSAMALCNCILIFMISLQAGSYLTMLNNSLAVFTGHIQIQHPDYLDHAKPRNSVAHGIELAAELRQLESVTSATARGVSFALLTCKQRSKAMQIVGVEAAFENSISSIPGTLRAGQYLSADTPYGLVLGRRSAQHLKADIGSEVTLLGSGRDGSFAASVMTVVGIVDSGMEELDRNTVFIRLIDFQEIFGFDHHVSHIAINSASLFEVNATINHLSTHLTPRKDLRIVDWNTLAPGLKQAIISDIVSALFIYSILIVVVIFSVLNNQLMAVLERRKEYGILLSLGIGHRRLTALLFAETALLAALGLIVGVFIGGVINAYFAHHGIAFEGMEQMAEKFNLPGRIYPVQHFATLFAGPLLVFIGSVCAAIYPALKLRKLHPVTARAGL